MNPSGRLEHLWNGWRAEYVQSGGEAGATVPPDDDHDRRSIFTRLRESGLPDEETHIVWRGDEVFVLMNAFPYCVGHMMVLPTREVADLEDLTSGESAELWATVTTAVAVLKAEYRPDGVNVGLNLGRAAGGSQSAHLHVHVVPRWIGDANFMTSVASTRTLPEALPDTAARLRAAWPERAA